MSEKVVELVDKIKGLTLLECFRTKKSVGK